MTAADVGILIIAGAGLVLAVVPLTVVILMVRRKVRKIEQELGAQGAQNGSDADAE